MAKSLDDSVQYIMTIFQRHRTRAKGTLLMHNLELPFSQDGWSRDNLDEALPVAIEKGWITIGKESKFVTLTEAGSIAAPVENAKA